MKKRQTKRLALHRETLRDLQLVRVQGGTGGTLDLSYCQGCGCFTETEGVGCQSTECIAPTDCVHAC